MRAWVLMALLAACGKGKVAVERAAPGAATEVPEAARAPTPVSPTSAGPGRVHLSLAGADGVVVSTPAGCEVVDGHAFSSTRTELRLHLNVTACPEGGCPASLASWLDSPAARSSRQGAEVLQLGDVGADRAVLVVRQPVLDTASVMQTDRDRTLVVACSAQAGHDDALDQAIVDTCTAVAIQAVRGAADHEPSAPSHALLCRR